MFIHKSSDTLNLLTEAKLDRRFRGAEHGLPALYAGMYVAEILREMTDEGDPHPQLFIAARQALDDLEAERSWRDVVLRFELTACRLLGHAPALESCVQCGNEVKRGARVPFAPIAGGVMCSECRRGQSRIIGISSGAVDVLANFSQSENSNEVEVPAKLRGEIRGIMNHYMANLWGRRPRMYEYLGHL